MVFYVLFNMLVDGQSKLLLAPILESLFYYVHADSKDTFNSYGVQNRSNSAESIIDSTYEAVIVALINSASVSVPYHKKKHLSKFWWDQEMKTLKAEAFSTYSIWVNAGKTRSGPILVSPALTSFS